MFKKADQSVSSLRPGPESNKSLPHTNERSSRSYTNSAPLQQIETKRKTSKALPSRQQPHIALHLFHSYTMEQLEDGRQ